MPASPTREWTAFCALCPAQEEVTRTLQGCGFCLTFQMDAVISPAYTQLPALPAQYHYRDPYGTEIIYLAGRDTPLDGERFPAHASRFWLYPGADQGAYQRVASALAVRWGFFWRQTEGSDARKDVA